MTTNLRAIAAAIQLSRRHVHCPASGPCILMLTEQLKIGEALQTADLLASCVPNCSMNHLANHLFTMGSHNRLSMHVVMITNRPWKQLNSPEDLVAGDAAIRPRTFLTLSLFISISTPRLNFYETNFRSRGGRLSC